MRIENNILYAVTENDLINGVFTIPEGIVAIGEKAFENLDNLRKVNCPESLKTIGDSAFLNCSNLSEIELPNSLESIEDSVFSLCSKIETIKLPENLKNLGENIFGNCSSLKSVKLPKNLKFIKENTFSGCTNLENLTLPENLTYIGKSAFENCQSIKSINLPESVTTISEKSFKNCINLTNINLPNNLSEIPNKCFDCCFSLETIKFPENLKTLGDYSFSNTFISSIDLPESINNIGDYTFNGCVNLKEIKIPENIKKLSKGLFQGCSNLETVTLPSNLEIIDNYSFFHCKNLRNITLPESLKTINHGAFSSCNTLENLKIPEGVNTIKPNVFDNCTLLSSIHIPNSVKEFGKSRNSFNFFEKCDDGFIVSSEQTSKSIPLNAIKINLPLLSRFWEHRENFFKEQKYPNICYFYNTFLDKQSDKTIKEFLDNHNFTFFKQLSIPDVPENRYQMYNMLFNLGTMSAPVEINGKKIDYAQKSVGFLLEKIRKSEINISQLRDIFIYMDSDGFKPEFTEFFMENFNGLLHEERFNKGFMSRCYNEFEEVQKTNTSNRGSQRQLKPTIMKFSYYFMENKFAGVNENNKHIADAISPYFHEQRTFDNALQIEQERIRKNIPDHILGKHLKEEVQPFKNIDALSDSIKGLEAETLNSLLETSFAEFSYDWLARNDPDNLILGKLCSCCAHLEGGGYGIMHASIVDKNVQNLVIRDGDGQIIAKSTLYINPLEQFGVFNNVEVNENVFDYDKQFIYKKFILGAKEFAEEYNRQHPERPLKQINVGMNRNDLTEELQKNSKESKKIFRSIDYSTYGIPNQLYSGDSELEQYIVWQQEQLSELEKQ